MLEFVRLADTVDVLALKVSVVAVEISTVLVDENSTEETEATSVAVDEPLLDGWAGVEVFVKGPIVLEIPDTPVPLEVPIVPVPRELSIWRG